MARLFSLPVVLGGAILASPALWAAFVDGTMGVETALSRWGVAVAACWFGLSLLSSLVEATAIPSRRTEAVRPEASAAVGAGGEPRPPGD